MHDISAVDKYILCLRINLFTKNKWQFNKCFWNGWIWPDNDRKAANKWPENNTVYNIIPGCTSCWWVCLIKPADKMARVSSRANCNLDQGGLHWINYNIIRFWQVMIYKLCSITVHAMAIRAPSLGAFNISKTKCKEVTFSTCSQNFAC